MTKSNNPIPGMKSHLIEAAAVGDIDAVKSLITGGMDVDSKPFCQTPLLIAATNGHKELVEWLIKNGADVDFENIWGETPISKATAAGHEDIVRILTAAKILKSMD